MTKRSRGEAGQSRRRSILAPPIGCHLVRRIATPSVNNGHLPLSPPSSFISCPFARFLIAGQRAAASPLPSLPSDFGPARSVQQVTQPDRSLVRLEFYSISSLPFLRVLSRLRRNTQICKNAKISKNWYPSRGEGNSSFSLVSILSIYRKRVAFNKSRGKRTGTKELEGLSIQIKQRLVLLPRKRFIVVTSRWAASFSFFFGNYHLPSSLLLFSSFLLSPPFPRFVPPPPPPPPLARNSLAIPGQRRITNISRKNSLIPAKINGSRFRNHNMNRDRFFSLSFFLFVEGRG